VSLSEIKCGWRESRQDFELNTLSDSAQVAGGVQAR
jgi:hypothetical protein